MPVQLLLGDEAVAQAAIDAGIAGAFAYPGTPSTEIFEYIQNGPGRTGEVSARWSANEKVAYEEALGMSYAGKRSLVSMKHVGLNVAADPFINSALTGANGALVLAIADDPGMHSSQNEQDSRFYAELAQVPCFEPSNQQEAYDMTRYAFEYSEAIGLPVMVRLVTRLAHSRSNVAGQPRAKSAEGESGRGLPSPDDWTLVPTIARRRFKRLVDLQGRLVDDAENSEFNKLTLAGPRGVIAAGLANNYLQEALGGPSDLSILKIGHYPIPVALLRRLVQHCDELLVLEDGYPFIEKRLNGLLGVPGMRIEGRLTGAVPITGELTPDNVAQALGRPMPHTLDLAGDLAVRPPQLCKGCPHADTFKAMVEASASHAHPILFSDIGCYTLGVLPPYRAVHATVDMGASIAMAHGAAQAKAYPVLCTIGDSTFTHSGMTPLIGAARADADMTVFVLDNATTAMTGAQESLATGEQLLQVLRGLGVHEDHLIVMDPVAQKHAENVDIIKREIAHRGLSVIVPTRACIHVKRKAKEADRETVGAAS